MAGRGSDLRAMAAAAADKRTAVLLEEAARIADRLDDMDSIIAGKGILELLRFRLVDDEGRVAEVKFDSVLSEARQQAVALRGLLAQVGVPTFESAPERRSTLDDLAARRERRDAGASGAAASDVRQ